MPRDAPVTNATRSISGWLLMRLRPQALDRRSDALHRPGLRSAPGYSRGPPPEQRAAPREPRADARAQHEIAVGHPAVFDRFEQREGDRRRGRVAVVLDV